MAGCVASMIVLLAAGAGWTWAAVLAATTGLLLILRGAVDAITATGVILAALLVLCWSAGWWQLLVPTASAGVLVIIWLDDRDWERRRDNGRQAERRGARGGAG